MNDSFLWIFLFYLFSFQPFYKVPVTQVKLRKSNAWSYFKDLHKTSFSQKLCRAVVTRALSLEINYYLNLTPDSSLNYVSLSLSLQCYLSKGEIMIHNLWGRKRERERGRGLVSFFLSFGTCQVRMNHHAPLIFFFLNYNLDIFQITVYLFYYW